MNVFILLSAKQCYSQKQRVQDSPEWKNIHLDLHYAQTWAHYIVTSFFILILCIQIKKKTYVNKLIIQHIQGKN